MRGVLVRPVSRGRVFLDVVCECGRKGLQNKETGEVSFKRPAVLGMYGAFVLVCNECQREYTIYSNGDYLQVEGEFPHSVRVLFYEDPWYCFSNFSSFRVRLHSTDWMTAEHAYQAAKFVDPDIIARIREAPSAYDTKIIAHAYQDKVVSWWEWFKIRAMEEIVRAKLEQHPYIQEKLLQTGRRELVEDSSTDSFWGRGPDWKGQNWLGRIWMRLRAELRDKPAKLVLTTEALTTDIPEEPRQDGESSALHS